MPLAISSLCREIRPSATLRLNAMVAEKKAQGADVISLAAGEPDFDTPKAIALAGKLAIDSGKTRYTASGGIPELRRAIAGRLQRDRGLSYAPGEILVGAGAKPVIAEALFAILNPGDEVLLPTPCWLSYPEMIRMAGGVPVPVACRRENGYAPEAEALEAAVTERTRALILNTPNNPTGAVFSEDTLRAVAEVAKRHDLYLLSDEIYEDLIYDGLVHRSVASLSDDAFGRSIVVSGFSKAFAMTGWRLGYAAGPRGVIQAMDAFQSHATGNPCSISQYAGLQALEGGNESVEAMREAFGQRRDLMVSLLKRLPRVSFTRPQGAFYVLLDVTGLLGRECRGTVIRTDTEFAEQLLEQALVCVVPGEPFGAPGQIRLSYAAAEDRIREALGRMEGFVGALAREAA